MSDPAPPPPGQMYLYDRMTPPLLDGAYRLTARTDVTLPQGPQDLPGVDGYFNVEGPRFTLPPSEVSGVFPPNNGHGSFADTLAHVALGRRTLPWERDPGLNSSADPGGVAPWIALLVLREGVDGYNVLPGQSLDQALPADAWQRLGSPAGVKCDILQIDPDLLQAILPTVEELSLLTHVRQVNVDDRELSAGDSDGWFSVVVSNRLPGANATCRACLVSLEGRSDLVSTDRPPSTPSPATNAAAAAPLAAAPTSATAAVSSVNRRLLEERGPVGTRGGVLPPNVNRIQLWENLVLLYSWKFDTISTGSFEELMQGLSVGAMGDSSAQNQPQLTDTGHLPMVLNDRAGTQEAVFYRGPLVPFPLTRDDAGPYHSADQCRRVPPEGGAEDISYAAAFEVGRLLAASDARLAQELMRWRREAYKQSGRTDVRAAIAAVLPQLDPLDLHAPWAPLISVGTSTALSQGMGPSADTYGLVAAQGAPGLDPAQLQQAWALPTAAAAADILQAGLTGLESPVDAPTQAASSATTLGAAAADTAALGRLDQARTQLMNNVQQTLGG